MERILDFIKRYRKFFALYFVWLVPILYMELSEGFAGGEFFTLIMSPLCLFVLYLAFKKPKK